MSRRVHRYSIASFPIILLVVVVASIAVGTSRLQAETRYVPSQYATIQAAIDASIDGDEIQVAAGTYNESIDLLGKALHLRSADGRDVTTIDGTGLNTSVITCTSGEDDNTILEGFTITGGTGTAGYGGGLYCVDSRPTVNECAFVANVATNGGGVFASNGIPTFRDCDFARNSATETGGAIEVREGGTLTVTRCSFIENAAGDMAGAIHGTDNAVVIAASTFERNTAEEGGCLRHYGGPVTISDSTFLNNSATEDEAGCVLTETDTLRITGCTFANNSSAHDGGAIATQSNLILSDCDFFDNSSGWEGGALFAGGVSNGISDCLFVRNTSTYSAGGAVELHCDWVTVQRCIFEDNEAADEGGAIGLLRNDVARIEECEFRRNVADDGGAIVTDRRGDAVVVDCLFESNTARYSGGAIYVEEESTQTIDRCSFVNNKAIGSNGGAIYSDEEAITRLVNSLLADNRSEYGNGGAIACTQTMELMIVNSTLASNTASRGGGLYCYESSPTITGSILWANEASISGDQVENVDDLSQPKFSYCSIRFSGGSGKNWDAELGIDGGGNLDVEPAFKGAASGDYRLQAGSLCIDAGDNEARLLGEWTDLNGLDRFRNAPHITDIGNGTAAIVDIGCYEFQARKSADLKIRPDPLVAGQPASFAFSRGTPNTRSYLVASRDGSGSTAVPSLNVVIDLKTPFLVGGSRASDSNGRTTWRYAIPSNAVGWSLSFQAVQLRLKTNVVETEVVE